MLLSELINNCGEDLSVFSVDTDKEVKGISLDSRTCKQDYLFAALPGSNTDGSKFIEDAMANGARYILSEYAKWEGEIREDITLISHKNIPLVLGLFAADFYGKEPENIAAVTGTNGKSSVVHFCRQIWNMVGEKSASIGTLGISDGDDYIYKKGTLTSPDSVSLHKTLSEFYKKGITHVAMEASSHGLNQYRLAGVKVKVAAITNITRDHLDYHGTYEKYFAAKMKLFSEILQDDHLAVVNADIDEFQNIEEWCDLSDKKIMDYGYNAKDIKLLRVAPNSDGQRIEVLINDKEYVIESKLIGSFQAHNLLCAIGLSLGLGLKAEDVLSVCGNVTNADGRMEKVADHPSGATIMIDYAHTPDALEKVLQALRPHTDGELVVLFGCGGDRDKGKRPLMGEVAAKVADRVVVTDDNPRGEDPAVIRKEIVSSCADAEEVAGRKEAIISAVKSLKKGDLLVIAGKGHEKTQIIGDKEEHFDEVEIIRKAIG